MEWAEKMPPKTTTLLLPIYASPFLLCGRRWLLHRTRPAWASSRRTASQWHPRDTTSVCPLHHQHRHRPGQAEPPSGRGQSQLCALHISSGALGPDGPSGFNASVQWREIPWSFVGYALLASIFPVSPSKYRTITLGLYCVLNILLSLFWNQQ